MLKIRLLSHARRLGALVAIAALVGCTNCTVPAFSLVPPGGGTSSCTANANSGVPLGTASTFAVLGGSTVTNTATPTIVSGDLGVWAGTAITGFMGIVPGGDGKVINGSIHSADATAMTAQGDLTTAYNDAAGLVAGSIPADIGGTTITPGVWEAPTSLQITGTVTLDGQNQTNPVFVFQMDSSTLTTGSSAVVKLINGANACNIFWQVGSSATLGTGTVFNGNILALDAITVNTGAVVNGRLLARNAAVTLDDNLVTRP